MKKLIIPVFLIITALLIVGYILFMRNGAKQNEFSETAAGLNSQISISNDQYQSRTDDRAEVTVEVTPKQLGTSQKNNIFSVSLNTHSVDLNFDFTRIIILKDDLDNVYQALGWSGGRDGHHLSGDIIFPALKPEAVAVELVINNINGIARTFAWDLK